MIRLPLMAVTMLMLATPVMAAEKDMVTPAPDASSTVVAPISLTSFEAPRRPMALPALYVSFGALQVVDARTTFAAVGRGAHETNPTLGQGNRSVVWAVKAASTASTIYFAERLWKKNRVAAVIVMAGINGGYAAIATHNMKQAR